MMRPPGPDRCPLLRAKKMYAGPPPGVAEFTTSAFWCLRTMSAIGPDGDPASDTDCVRGRQCFSEEEGHE
jgi:hypothetical protein